MATVLIVDDEPEVLAMLCRMLEQGGFAVTGAASGSEAIKAYRKMAHDVVVTDMCMPQMDGLGVIRDLKQLDRDAAIVVLTGFGELGNAVTALHDEGVYHYLTKPLEGPDVLESAVNGALERRRLTLENKALVSRLERTNKELEKKGAQRSEALRTTNDQLKKELKRRKQSEQALQQTQKHLEQRVAERTQKLVDVNRQLNQEIRERRNTEAALNKSEQNAQMQLLELELLYSSSPVGLCMLDKNFKLIKANATMAHIVGQPLNGRAGSTLDQIYSPLADQLEPTCRNLMATGRPRLSYLITLPGRNSTHRRNHWLVSSYPLKLQDESIIASSHIFQDITELRHAEELIVQSKTMLQALFDGISDPLLMVDRSMTICMLNRAAKAYYQIEAFKDILGKRWQEIAANAAAGDMCPIIVTVTAGKAKIFERPGLLDNEKIEKVAIYPLSQSAIGLSGAIIQVSDITEAKILERQLVHNEKLASLGMLVAGIAHEINNPNGFITFNLPILRNYLDAMVDEMMHPQKGRERSEWFGMPFEEFRKEVFSLIGNMEHGSQRISKIVSSLRALVRSESKGGTQPPVALPQIIENIQTLCRVELQQRVHSFTVDCPDNLPMVQVDTEALEQVLINLLVNAAHAADKSQSWIRMAVKRVANDALSIKIRDNGRGMDEAMQQKIFAPFFTTKAPGVGTGLGLSLCHNLVNSLGGSIQVESTPGKGSTFCLTLPVRFVDDAEAAAVVSPTLDHSLNRVAAIPPV